MDTEVWIDAVFALSNIAVNDTNQILVAQAGVISVLARLPRDANTNFRRVFAEALKNIAANAANQILVAEAGAILPLVGLLRDADFWVRMHAAGALKNIAENAANRIPLARAGAIPPLVGLLGDVSSSARGDAIDALSDIACNAANQILVARAGAIPLLVSLLSDSDGLFSANAAVALRNIVYNNTPNQKALIAAAGIEKLNELVVTSDNALIIEYAQLALHACQPALEEQTKSVPAASSQSTTSYTLTSTESGKETPEPGTFDMKALDESLFIGESEIKIRREIGRGGFGVVYEGQYLHQAVAIKRYLGTQMPEKEMNEFRHEVRVMGDLRHECLVRLLGVLLTDNAAPGLVMEYGANGSLYGCLHSRQEMSWSLRFRIAEELGRGLAFLHAKNIIHCDIKSLNAVLDRDMRAKWCDFGLAVLKLHTSNTTKEGGDNDTVGTLRWMAPELFSRRTSTPSKLSDVWALGMVLFELASREVPFKDARNQAQIQSWIMSGEGEEVPVDCAQQSPSFAALMSRCWAERNSRPTASEIACELENLSRNFSENTGKKASVSDESSYMHFSGHGK